jgi:hypothetical protein
VSRQGERIVVRLHFAPFAHLTQIASAITNVSESSAFTHIQYQGTMAGAGKNGIATISMEQH